MEVTSFPPTPSSNKDYYFQWNSNTKEIISDKLETRNNFQNSRSLLEHFAKGTTASSAHATEAIATGVFNHRVYKTAFDKSNWQSLVFGWPYCGISSIFERNFASIRFEAAYLKQFEALNNILSSAAPKFARMTPEQRSTKPEQSTTKHEGSEMVHLSDYSTTKTDYKTESLKTKCEASDFNFINNHTHEHGSIEKSTFMPVGYNADTNTLNNELLDGFKLAQKRKLHPMTMSMNSENSGLDVTYAKEKRFKTAENQSIYNGLYESNQPFYYGEKPAIYYNPSFTHNALYSTLNGFSAQPDTARNFESNLNTFSNEPSKHFGLNSKDGAARIYQEEMRTLNSQINPADFRNNLRVGATELQSHGKRDHETSFPKNTQRESSVELKQSSEHEEHFSSHSEKFISLDSTKSSFLTLIGKMRQPAENDIMPCPFCSQTFAKYPDLKMHVQTHKHANIAGNGEGIRTDETSLGRGQSPVSSAGNTMSTPVSSPSPRPPSRRLSIGEAGSPRSTSVIQFAEKH